MPIKSECPRPEPELAGTARELFDRLCLPWNTPQSHIVSAAKSARAVAGVLDEHAALLAQAPTGHPCRRVLERHGPHVLVDLLRPDTPPQCGGCGYDPERDDPPAWPCVEYLDAAEALGLIVRGG